MVSFVITVTLREPGLSVRSLSPPFEHVNLCFTATEALFEPAEFEIAEVEFAPDTSPLHEYVVSVKDQVPSPELSQQRSDGRLVLRPVTLAVRL